jgi:hypothetical protein
MEGLLRGPLLLWALANGAINPGLRPRQVTVLGKEYLFSPFMLSGWA